MRSKNNRSGLSKVALITFTTFSLLSIAGCSPKLGPDLELKEIPIADAPTGAKVGLGRAVSIGEISDARTVVDGESDQITHAAGNLTEMVETALKDTLTRNGFTLSPTAPLKISGQIVKWQTKVSTKATTQVNSEAAVAISVRDKGKKTVYSGTYSGSRYSEGPVASKNDIRHSLGIAMSNAINQLVEDQRMIKTLVKN